MSLAEHLTIGLPNCRYAHVYAGLDANDQTTLTAALANPALTSAHITRALRAEGHKIGEDTVRKHRTGDCACP